MAVVEKRVPQYLSIAATLSSVVVVAWFWHVGMQNPRKYVSTMAINKHAGYEITVGCKECHVPVGGWWSLAQEMNCTSAKCHGELHPDTLPEERMRLAMEIYQYRPDPELRSKVYLRGHWKYIEQGTECWSCHKEHSPAEHQTYGATAGSPFLATTPPRRTEYATIRKDKG